MPRKNQDNYDTDQYNLEDLIRFWSMAEISMELKLLAHKVRDLEAQLEKERKSRDETFRKSQETQMNWVMAAVRGDLVPAGQE
jgi:hypothetical protein